MKFQKKLSPLSGERDELLTWNQDFWKEIINNDQKSLKNSNKSAFFKHLESPVLLYLIFSTIALFDVLRTWTKLVIFHVHVLLYLFWNLGSSTCFTNVCETMHAYKSPKWNLKLNGWSLVVENLLFYKMRSDKVNLIIR